MGTSEEVDAVHKELSILRERLNAASVEREKLLCALDMAENATSKLREAFLASQEHIRQELALTQSNFSSEREELNKTISELSAQIEELQANANELSNQIGQLLRSTSWKVSAPVRIIGRWLPIAAGFGRRFARLSRLSYSMLGRADPAVSRTFFKNHPHVQAAGLSPSIETETAQLEVFTKFVNLQNRSGRKVVLIAAEYPPMNDKDGGGLRLYNLVRVFSQMDRRVVFISRCSFDQFTVLAGAPTERKRYEDLLYQTGIEHLAYGAEGEQLLRALSGDLHWAYLSSPIVGDELIPMVRLHAPWAKIIYDMPDFHALRSRRESGLKKGRKSGPYANQIELVELTNVKIADLNVVASEQERRELLEIDQALAIEVVPDIFEIPANIRLDIAERTGLLFASSCWSTSSIDDVLWFVSEIWPLIRRTHPDSMLRIVGHKPPGPICSVRDQPGIEVLENVRDLINLFTYSRMSVVPLRSRAGARHRVGMSLANGLPVVASSVASEGMAIEHGEHLLIADTPIDFANEVLRLMADDDLWIRLQSNGRSFIQKQTDFAKEKLRDLVNG